MSTAKKHILVTGGAGFIGSHTCKQLAQLNFIPVVYDNLARGHGNFCQWGPLVKADLQETARIVRVIREYSIESVIHFAAFAYVPESMQKPQMYYENNVMGSLSLLKACLETNIQHFIFSSSCATYGIPSRFPIAETEKQNPVNPYGRTKLFTEQMIKDLTLASQMKAVCLRYFNAAGSDPEFNIGESHDPETHLIPNVILTGLGKKTGLQIYGNDYPTPDGTCVRDYLHVCDLARAHVLALTKLMEHEILPFAMNLGTGVGTSNLEIIRLVEKIMNKKLEFQLAEKRAGDPPYLVADPTLAKTALGFQAHYKIEDMITHSLAWLGQS